MVVSFRKQRVVKKKTINSPLRETVLEAKPPAPLNHKLLFVITQNMSYVFCDNGQDHVKFMLQVALLLNFNAYSIHADQQQTQTKRL